MMPIAYVAHSKQLALWGADVGLGKNLFLVSAAEDLAAAHAFLALKPCGFEDWSLLKQQDNASAEPLVLQDKLAGKAKRIDPTLYPRLRGFLGLFKVKPESVENHLLVKMALDGANSAVIKVKITDMAAYLLHNALK